MKRVCICCKKEKNFDEFVKCSNSKNGFRKLCKKCRSQKDKFYRKKLVNSKKVKVKNKHCSLCDRYREAKCFNKNKYTKCGLYTYCRDCEQTNRDPNKTRERILKRIYGITLQDYDKMYVQQNGKCAICGTNTPGGQGRFHVDHCHKTHTVRALLCTWCNCGLGNFKDCPESLEKAANYIRVFQED